MVFHGHRGLVDVHPEYVCEGHMGADPRMRVVGALCSRCVGDRILLFCLSIHRLKFAGYGVGLWGLHLNHWFDVRDRR